MSQHLYKDQPDERQSEDTQETISRFRPRYRALTDEEKALHDEIKVKAEELEALYDKLTQGRYTSLAVTKLEESVMWAVKQLTS